MSILVLSPTEIIAEALTLLLISHGFDASRDVAHPADLVLRDLIGAKPPYPIPSKVLTYALIETDALKERTLIKQGYHRCFDVNKGPEALITTLKAKNMGSNSVAHMA